MFEYTDRMYIRSGYTEQYKSTLTEIIEKLVDWAKMTRHEGLLSIEDDINEIEGDFYKIIFQMLIDGINADIQFDFGRNIIQTTKTNGVELRSMMLYNKGIAMINNGDRPELVELILYSMIGKYKFNGEIL